MKHNSKTIFLPSSDRELIRKALNAFANGYAAQADGADCERLCKLLKDADIDVHKAPASVGQV